MQKYDFDCEDDDEEEKTEEIAKSVSAGDKYIRTPGRCRRYGCNKMAAPHQVYCSRDHAPCGNLAGDSAVNDGKQVYKTRKRKRP